MLQKINREPWRTVWVATCALAERPPPECRRCGGPGPGSPPPTPGRRAAALLEGFLRGDPSCPPASPAPAVHLLPCGPQPSGLRTPAFLVLGSGLHWGTRKPMSQHESIKADLFNNNGLLLFRGKKKSWSFSRFELNQIVKRP